MTTYFFDECTTDITMPQGWKDISYKNDACPSWSFNGFQVFIDHPDPNERELGPETSRFYVKLEEEYGENQTWFHSCDRWAEVLTVVRGMMYTREYVTNMKDYYSDDPISGLVYRKVGRELSEEERTYLHANICIEDNPTMHGRWQLVLDRSIIASDNADYLEARLIEWAKAEYDEDFPNSFEENA